MAVGAGPACCVEDMLLAYFCAYMVRHRERKLLRAVMDGMLTALGSFFLFSANTLTLVTENLKIALSTPSARTAAIS